MRNSELGETWTFDGRPSTGFSYLHRMGHQGYKGVWIANLLGTPPPPLSLSHPALPTKYRLSQRGTD